MTPEQILHAILELATLAEKAVESPSGPDSTTDWLKVVLSDPVQTHAKGLATDLLAQNFDDVIAALRRQHDTLAPTPAAFATLSENEQLAVSKISDTIIVLSGKNVAVSLDQQPIQWLAEHVLPLAETALPIVIALL